MLTLCGYLLCWHDVADLGDGREQFQPGAFINGSARLVFGHDPRPGAILGFARVVQDRHGAPFSVELDEHRRDVRQVACALRNGLNSCSFRFKPFASRKSGDLTVVERASLIEISIVSDPAYQAGGCWLAIDEPYLPPRLAALAEQFGTAAPLAHASRPRWCESKCARGRAFNRVPCNGQCTTTWPAILPGPWGHEDRRREPSDPQVRSSWLSSTPQSLALTFGRIFDRCGPYSGRATGERL